MHPPKNFLPTAATQMNFETRELNAIWHWSLNSRMNERYDRSVCGDEILRRNAIIQKVASWWNMVGSFRLHETVPGSKRIGKDPSTFPPAVVGLNCSHATLPIVASTQEHTPSVATPLEETIAELINVSPPGELPAEQS